MTTPQTPSAGQESASLEFKDRFDPKHDWPNLIKDIVAIANSGGGKILVGINDDGTPSKIDVRKLLETDMADVVNRLRSATDVNFSALTIDAAIGWDPLVAEITIGASATPLVFGREGTFKYLSGDPGCAYAAGTLYVRHGPKSEPATTDDLRTMLEKQLERQRAALLVNMRQVMEAPEGATIQIVAPSGTEKGSGPQDVNKYWPWLLKDLIRHVNDHFEGKVNLGMGTQLAIRRAMNIDAQKKFVHKPKLGSPQFSDAYINWLIQQIESNPHFIDECRAKYNAMLAETNTRKRAKRYL